MPRLTEQEQQFSICSPDALQTIEATIDEQGNVRLLELIQLPEPRRAYVTILPGEAIISETVLLSEAALEEDWDRSEEEKAWSHLM